MGRNELLAKRLFDKQDSQTKLGLQVTELQPLMDLLKISIFVLLSMSALADAYVTYSAFKLYILSAYVHVGIKPTVWHAIRKCSHKLTLQMNSNINVFHSITKVLSSHSFISAYMHFSYAACDRGKHSVFV